MLCITLGKLWHIKQDWRTMEEALIKVSDKPARWVPAPPEEIKLRVIRFHKNAILPQRKTIGSAGYDLYNAEDFTIPAQGKVLVGTGLKIKIPHGYYGRIAPRSGFSWNNMTDVAAGVIDEDYRGEVMIMLYNHSRFDVHVIRQYEAIAQLILERIATPPVEEVIELDETQRGEKGFGSTDKK